MATYHYKGFTSSGKNVKGTVDAENKKTAQAKLQKRRGLYYRNQR